jgi:starch phosphorylase
MDAAYTDSRRWMKSVVMNIAMLGRFSSDETIRRYARDIWAAEPVKIPAEAPRR